MTNICLCKISVLSTTETLPYPLIYIGSIFSSPVHPPFFILHITYILKLTFIYFVTNICSVKYLSFLHLKSYRVLLFISALSFPHSYITPLFILHITFMPELALLYLPLQYIYSSIKILPCPLTYTYLFTLSFPLIYINSLFVSSSSSHFHPPFILCNFF